MADERNADVQIYINGEFFPRDEAKISVFDSGFLVGDGIWEGIRLHHGHVRVPRSPPRPAVAAQPRPSTSTSG